jgi:hypothetical protein
MVMGAIIWLLFSHKDVMPGSFPGSNFATANNADFTGRHFYFYLGKKKFARCQFTSIS